jgi:type VI secretion system ImpA family protein
MQHEDLDTLLAPISEESPAGEDLRFEGTYDRIQEARREDDAGLSQGVWQTALKRADWDAVERIALDVLCNRSKDLQVAIWLLEARTVLHGFAGFASSMRLINALCETYWEGLYPRLEDGDPEYRLSPVEWMNEKLGLRLKGIQLTSPASDGHHSYTWADLESATRLETAARKDPSLLQKKTPETRVTMAQFDTSRMLTPETFYASLQEDLSGGVAGIDRLAELLRERCGNGAPSLGRLRDVLVNVGEFVASTLRERKGILYEEDPQMETTTTPGAEEIADGDDAPLAPRVGEIRSRNDAYAMLASIADYLMKVEPHSPTPYLIRRAVSWGSMPLTTLLQELMEEGNKLADIYKLLGIRDQ